jgi:hypothetical protein
MSTMEVLTFFLGFQMKQAKEGTFIIQMKYTRDILKKFGMDKASQSRCPWALMVILILSWMAHQVIKRYITPWLDLYFTFVHLGPISCLVCVYVQDSKPHPKIVI